MGYWKEIIRTAYPISNSLWYSGKYRLRVSIANYIDVACINLLSQNIISVKLSLDDIPINYIRNSILIDDMGWTLFRLNKKFYAKARENIFKGINIAENEKYYDLLLKGYKHLFCITVELDKCFDNTQAYFDKINSILTEEEYLQISDNERSSIEAGLYYSLSASYLTVVKQIKNESEQKEYFLYQAKEYIEKSIQYYRNFDIERYIKTFSVKAEILFLLDPLKYMPLIDELINEGIVLSQLHQERDRYFRLIILKMQVLLWKIQESLNKYELEILKHELSTIQHEVQKSIKVSPLYYRQYKKLYKQIKSAIKNKLFKFSYH